MLTQTTQLPALLLHHPLDRSARAGPRMGSPPTGRPHQPLQHRRCIRTWKKSKPRPQPHPLLHRTPTTPWSWTVHQLPHPSPNERGERNSIQVNAHRICASPMQRILGIDNGARLSLMQMLEVRDLASLLRSGRSWSGWIQGEPSALGDQLITIYDHSLSSFDRCGWIQRSVRVLSCFTQGLDQLLLWFARLRSLEIITTDRSPLESRLRECFAAMAPTLQSFQLRLALAAGTLDTLVVWIDSAIRLLSGLVSLTIKTVGASISLASVSLSFLPSMRRLQHFHLELDRHADGPSFRECTPEQVEVLSQCTTLTSLHCGRWLPIANGPISPERFATLVSRRKENGAAPFRFLFLVEPALVIDPVGWQTLSQCTELESFSAWWSAALSADDWMQLTHFRQLHSLTIRGTYLTPSEKSDRATTLDLDRVCPALQHCGALRRLEINGRNHKFELRVEHVAALARIPSLQELSLEHLRIESLHPLSVAPSLTTLTIRHCTGLDGQRIHIRSLTPPMALVSQLTIHDTMPAAPGKSLMVALLQRLPKLTRAGLSC